MTKKEFYEKYRQADVSLSDLQVLISNEDLYDSIYIMTDYEYDEEMSSDIRNALSNGDSWTEIRDWLNNIVISDWYVRDDWGEISPTSDTDVPEFLDIIEEILSGEPEWEDELPGDEETEEETNSLEIEMLFCS